MDCTLRLAAPADRLLLIELQRRASLAIEANRADLLAHPEVVDLPADQILAGRVIVAEYDGVIVGFSVMLAAKDGEAELDGLFVEPDCWRGGVGRRLLDAAEELARRDRATSAHVIANPAALAFYAACGYRAAGQAETLFGPAPALRKMLDP